MGYAAYPTAADVIAFLRDAGIGIDDIPSLTLGPAVAAARRDFERITGRRMLAVSGTRTFTPDPYNANLILRADLAALTSLSLGGVLQTMDTDFVLRPDGAWDDELPVEWITFANPWGLGLYPGASVSITGLWGYGVTIPEDAWQAMVMRAAGIVMVQVSAARSGGLEEWEEAGVREKAGKTPYEAQISGWATLYQAIAGHFRKNYL